MSECRGPWFWKATGGPFVPWILARNPEASGDVQTDRLFSPGSPWREMTLVRPAKRIDVLQAAGESRGPRRRTPMWRDTGAWVWVRCGTVLPRDAGDADGLCEGLSGRLRTVRGTCRREISCLIFGGLD